MEQWDVLTSYPARVLKINEFSISCDCFITKEPLVVDVRDFPKLLFDDVKDLKEGSNVLLTIGIRPGTTIMIVSETNDDLNQLYEDGWKELEELNFENKRAF